MTSLSELREEVWRANLRLPSEGLVSLTWGNVSARSDDGSLVAIKPSGVPYADLGPDDVVVLDLEGRIVAGDLRPSIDTATHLELYRAFPGIGAVVHAHSTYGTAFSQARLPIDCLGTTHADHFAGPITVTRPLSPDEVGEGYEVHTGRVIVEHMLDTGRDPLHVPAVLVAGHAPFVWGTTPAAAVDNAVTLEVSAHMALVTRLLSGGNPPVLESWILATHHERKHGKNAYYGQGEG